MDKKTGGARAYMGILLSGVLAGMMISVGGTVYLSVDSKVAVSYTHLAYGRGAARG